MIQQSNLKGHDPVGLGSGLWNISDIERAKAWEVSIWSDMAGHSTNILYGWANPGNTGLGLQLASGRKSVGLYCQCIRVNEASKEVIFTSLTSPCLIVLSAFIIIMPILRAFFQKNWQADYPKKQGNVSYLLSQSLKTTVRWCNRTCNQTDYIGNIGCCSLKCEKPKHFVK